MAKNQENLEAVEAPKVEIIRGRMPVAIVALIRFGEEETSTSACAAKYRTTVGKVDDIRKGRNFGYVDSDFVPTQEQADAALAYIDQLEDADSIVEALAGLGITEDGSEFEAKRSSMRKSTKKEVAEDDVEVEASDDDLEDLTE